MESRQQVTLIGAGLFSKSRNRLKTFSLKNVKKPCFAASVNNRNRYKPMEKGI